MGDSDNIRNAEDNRHKEVVERLFLNDILNPFREAQRDYLCLRIKGIGIEKAIELANRKKQTIEFWRDNDPEFKRVEEYLISNKELYAKEAGEYFGGYFFSITYGLLKIANKVNEWEEISKRDRTDVFRACKLLSELRKELPSDGVHSKGYDDQILKAHRER